MLSSHRKTASRPRHFSQPIELARFDIVGRAAADGARLKEDLTNIDSWSLGLHKDSKDPESFWNFSADSSTLGRSCNDDSRACPLGVTRLGAETARTHGLTTSPTTARLLLALPLLSFPTSVMNYRVRQI
jgi:hypothetical protein